MRSTVWVMVLGALAVLALLFGLDVVNLSPEVSDEEREERAREERLRGGVELAGAGPRAKEEEAVPEVDPETAAREASIARGSRPGGARVEGRVLRAQGEVPLPGARVLLDRPDAIAHWLGVPTEGRADVLEAKSGPEGTFSFVDVLPGRGYRVRAVKEGLCAATSALVDLFPGDRRDVGDLALEKGHPLSGRVVDAEGKPVPGAQVLVTWRIRSALQIVLTDLHAVPETEQRLETDSSGRFRFEGLEAGEKTLLARAPSGAEGGRTSVLVSAAAEDVGDVVLPGRGVLAGKVVWVGGEPLPGARVFAAPRFNPLVRSVTTGPDGSFRFEWLDPGENQVLGVLVPGMPVHLVENLELGQEDILVEFPLAGRLSGRVVAAGGAPVARFEVQAQMTSFAHPMLSFVMAAVYKALGPTAFESERGEFALPPLAPGSYVVRVTAAGHAPGVASGVVVESGKTTEVRVELGAGVTASGEVTRASGEGLEGARLFLFPEGRIAPEADVEVLDDVTDDRMPEGLSGADGTFTLPMQSPGRYDLVATHDDAVPGVLRGVDLRGTGASGLRVRLAPAGRVAGKVLLGDGKPAARESLWILFPEGRTEHLESDAEGRFEAKRLPLGRCVVSVHKRAIGMLLFQARHDDDPDARRAAYDRLAQDLGEQFVEDGRLTEVTLRVPRRTETKIRIRRGGLAAEDCTGAFLRAPEGGYGKWERVKGGEFEMALEPGAYLVWLNHSEDEWTQRTIDVPDAPTADLEIGLP